MTANDKLLDAGYEGVKIFSQIRDVGLCFLAQLPAGFSILQSLLCNKENGNF